RLNAHNTPYVLVTNNTKTPSNEFFTFMQGLGFAIRKENYIDPLMVLEEVLPPVTVAAYGDPKFLALLQEGGYRLTYTDPKAVLIGMKKDFTAKEYAQMIELVLGGAKLVGMHATSIYAKEGRTYPGIGAILQMIAYACNCDYEVVGKPAALFYEKALAKTGAADFAQVEMISDDMKGDLFGAKELGMRTTLVLSGKVKDAAIAQTAPRDKKPDRVVSDIGKLL
ncbi:MAG: HAD-IIA family hydrolase, partial [Campylobacterota bacterium]